MTSHRPTIHRVLAAALVCSVLLIGGCYEKVVGASGFGAQGVSVEKPNGPDNRPASKTFEYKPAKQRELASPGSK